MMSLSNLHDAAIPISTNSPKAVERMHIEEYFGKKINPKLSRRFSQSDLESRLADDP